MHLPTVSPAGPRTELGPRSLGPGAFLGRGFRAYSRPEVAYRLLQLNTTCEHEPGLLNPRRDGGLDLLPFLTCHALSLAGAVTRGEPRASIRPAPVLVPPARAGLPSRDTDPNAPPRDALRRSCIVRIDAHGSKDRAKDASAGRTGRSLDRAAVHALGGACATTFPSSATSGHPLSSARRPPARGYPREHDGPTEVRVPTALREERRLSEDRDAFHRHDTRRRFAEGGIPPAFAPALPLTPPTLSPQVVESAWKGIASATVRSPAIRDVHPRMVREYRRLCYPRDHAWD